MVKVVKEHRLRTVSWAVGYSLFQVTQGLLIHPYQTMRQIVRERVFLWMAGSPMLLWICALGVWKLLEIVLFSFFPYPTFWLFLAMWFTIGIALYQILLLYLLLRFLLATR